MIRAVLVGPHEGTWRLYRQPQWMAEVRRDPSATARPRRIFDIEDDAFPLALEALAAPDADGPAILEGLGAVAVAGP